jgi:hypothetical protein
VQFAFFLLAALQHTEAGVLIAVAAVMGSTGIFLWQVVESGLHTCFGRSVAGEGAG